MEENQNNQEQLEEIREEVVPAEEVQKKIICL